MRHGMVAHQMSRGADATDQFTALTHEAANHEEGRPHLVAGEDLQDRLSAEVVGAVVIGESEFTCILSRENRLPEELRGGPHAGVEIGSGGETGGASDGADCGKHASSLRGEWGWLRPSGERPAAGSGFSLEKAIHHKRVHIAETRVQECPGQAADDLEAELAPEVYGPLIAADDKVELHRPKASGLRVFKGMGAHG